MDPGALLGLLLPIGAVAILLAAIIMGSKKDIARMRLEEARLRGPGGANSEEVQALRNELENLRRELSELGERVDFAERLLARGRSPDFTQRELGPRPDLSRPAQLAPGDARPNQRMS